MEKRATGKIDLLTNKMKDKQRLRYLMEKTVPSADKHSEEVVLKATNRAIEKVLGLALFFQGQDDCKVQLKTGSVGVVDDIVVNDAAANKDELSRAEEEELDNLPESRVRKATIVEVAISLK